MNILSNIKQFVRQSKTALILVSNLVYQILKLTLKLESCLCSLNNFLIKNSTGLFTTTNSLSLNYYQMLARKIMPFRFTNDMEINSKHLGVPLKSSFADAMFQRYRHGGGIVLPEWKLDNKSKGLEFARALGLQTAHLFQDSVGLKDIVPRENTVIKPLTNHSSVGVYVIKSLDDIQEVATGNRYSSWQQLTDYIMSQIAQQVVSADRWLVEEFLSDDNGYVLEDLKFNVFYGQIGWIATQTGRPDSRFHIMDSNGQNIVEKFYKKDELYISRSVTTAEKALAKMISLEIPAPFVRVDFLRGNNNLYFGEFTPKPGIIGYMGKERDNLYGKMFHEAQARLDIDLIKGKKFDKFNRLFNA